jgi:hypothetical protein
MFNADPYLTATVDEFRIYQGALTPSQISSALAAGPNVLPTPGGGPKLGINLGQGSVTITWPTGGRGYILQSSGVVNTGWTNSNLSVTVQNGQNTATDTISGSAKFYRLQLGP